MPKIVYHFEFEKEYRIHVFYERHSAGGKEFLTFLTFHMQMSQIANFLLWNLHFRETCHWRNPKVVEFLWLYWDCEIIRNEHVQNRLTFDWTDIEHRSDIDWIYIYGQGRTIWQLSRALSSLIDPRASLQFASSHVLCELAICKFAHWSG